ncbi:MAG: Inorganic pyrophosphatase [Breznakia sp.]
MKEFENNALFWQKLDTIYVSSEIVIEHKKNTAHPRFVNAICPVDYGFLRDTMSAEMSKIDVFIGSGDVSRIHAIMVSVDILKKDCEIKILIGCSEEETHDILVFLNENESQKCVLLRRGKDVPEWASKE